MNEYCPFCQKETAWETEKSQTPQGYPMKVKICSVCGVRILTNDPEADHVANGGQLVDPFVDQVEAVNQLLPGIHISHDAKPDDPIGGSDSVSVV